MKAFIAALLTMAVIGAGAFVVLDKQVQMSAEQAFATSGARVSPHH